MKMKNYLIISLCGVLFCLGILAALVYYVDPYFQYHTPREGLAYHMEMNSFSYYNAGIGKNFEYDTVITGSSMSRAMEPSYIDEKFDCKSVKLSMAEARGADYKTLLTLLEKQPNLERVIIGLDTFAYYVDKEYSSYEKPEYLYDDNLWNDVQYLMNMDGVVESLKVLIHTIRGGETTTMDEYQNYAYTNTFSKEKVLQIYYENVGNIQESSNTIADMKRRTIENVEYNLIPFIKNNPEVEFVFYYPPYSIAKWGLTADIDIEIECMKTLAEKLFAFKNVSLHFTQGDLETITDLEHYMDTIHYDNITARKIIDQISDETYKMQTNTYETMLDDFAEFVKEYKYKRLTIE